jgi:anti-sigma-K factor RskA
MTQDPHELAGVYALDALPEEERRRFEAHLADCVTCQQEVDGLQEVTATLAELTETTPPPALRAQVLARIDQEPQLGAPGAAGGEPAPAPHGEVPSAPDPARDGDGAGEGDELARRRRRSWPTSLMGTAAAVVLVLGLGVSVLIAGLYDRIGELEAASDDLVELLAAPDADTVTIEGPEGEVARVVHAPSRGEALFVADGMGPAPTDHAYELWLIDEEGAHSAGLLDLDEGGRTVHRLRGDVQRAVAVGVTVEPEGGSPEPTTDPVMLLELADT